MTSSRQTGEPLRGGDEHDALTRWRRWLRFRPGDRKAAKTAFNRRVRKKPVQVDDSTP